MGIFIGLIIAAAAIGCGIWAFCSFDNDNAIIGTIATILCIVAIIAFIIVPWSFHTVDTGEVAVVKHFGEAKEVKQPGLNYNFWGTHKFVYLDTKVQDLPIEAVTYSSDAQTMSVQMNVQFKIREDKALEIVKTYGTLEALTSRIQSVIIEQPKTVLSTHTAMDIIANRGAMTPAVEEAIREAIDDAYYIDIIKVTITNIDFSDAFEQAVEDKMIAEQAKLKAEYENEKIVAAAKAEAEAKIVAAEAEAKANELLEKSLTDKILQQMYIEKWDGKLPETVAGEDATLMIPTSK
jgi:regulator of protease activity HflC (stomatin/prohibitin superfamily)